MMNEAALASCLRLWLRRAQSIGYGVSKNTLNVIFARPTTRVRNLKDLYRLDRDAPIYNTCSLMYMLGADQLDHTFSNGCKKLLPASVTCPCTWLVI